jgi:hypothetical protein
MVADVIHDIKDAAVLSRVREKAESLALNFPVYQGSATSAGY